MSQTLYRKYRSQRFAEIIGQAPVVRILRNSIARGRLNHAYLFSGPRGTGKTSIARIFAKALNCLTPQDGDACGVCDVCMSIAAGNAVDVIEIDAASNRGIDDIRDLRERVNYAPLELKRKVYIIDEVHMITGPAWNALLKTLEEPPSHVIFCLCTTEANKVPITILSRCIRFDFQRLPLPELAAHLESIAATEGFTLELGCGMKLAQLAEGSARDAISLLDQLTVFCDSVIRPQDIDELFQLGDPQLIRDVTNSVLSGHSAEALEAWSGLMERGVDAGSFLLQLAEEIKQRYLADPTAQSSAALDAVWQGLNLLKYDNFPALLVELTLIQAAGTIAASLSTQVARAAAPEPHRDSPPVFQPAESQRPNAQADRPLPQAPVRVEAPPPVRPTTQSSALEPAPSKREERPAPSSSTPQASGDVLEIFREKVRSVRLTTYALLLRAVSARLDGNRLLVTFAATERQAQAYAAQPDALAVLRDAARQLYGQHTVIELRREGESPTASEPLPVPAPTPPVNEPEPLHSTNGHSGSGLSSAAELESNAAPEDRAANFEDAIRLFGIDEEEST